MRIQWLQLTPTQWISLSFVIGSMVSPGAGVVSPGVECLKVVLRLTLVLNHLALPVASFL